MKNRFIPAELRAHAVVVPGLPDGADGWHPAALRQLLEALSGSTVAVIGIVAFARFAWGYEETETAWSCTRMSGEFAHEFAERSRRLAAAFLDGLWTNGSMGARVKAGAWRKSLNKELSLGLDDALFVVTLDGQDQACSNVTPR